MFKFLKKWYIKSLDTQLKKSVENIKNKIDQEDINSAQDVSHLFKDEILNYFVFYPINIKASNINYYLYYNNKLAMVGHIDNNNLEQTIANDFLNCYLSYNILMAHFLNNEEALSILYDKIFNDIDLFLQFCKDVQSGNDLYKNWEKEQYKKVQL